MTMLNDCDMTVKVNTDHLQNKIALRAGQGLPLVKISCKSMFKFLHEPAHTDR